MSKLTILAGRAAQLIEGIRLRIKTATRPHNPWYDRVIGNFENAHEGCDCAGGSEVTLTAAEPIEAGDFLYSDPGGFGLGRGEVTGTVIRPDGSRVDADGTIRPYPCPTPAPTPPD